jgi:hypothetical protein
MILKRLNNFYLIIFYFIFYNGYRKERHLNLGKGMVPVHLICIRGTYTNMTFFN